jgi:hypothetical protein
MKKITITVDTADWEYFCEDEKEMGYIGQDEVIKCFQRNTDIERKYPPQLRIVGKEAPKETKQNTSDITRIGLAPTVTETELNIENSLYDDLVWAAERNNTTATELASEWAGDYIKKPEVTETTKIFFEYLGLDLIKAVK